MRRACGDDPELGHEVAALLDSHRRLNGFLEPPPGVDPRSVSDLAAATLVGRAFGPYQVRRLLGRGGMGVVYEATRGDDVVPVALKVLRPGVAAPETLRRFEHEVGVLRRLHHPGIARIYDAGMADGGGGLQPYFAMERIDGLPLTTYAETRALRLRDRLHLLQRVCDAVHHAHARGVIHRDLKPDNVFVTRGGVPKVLDFGVARATDVDVCATTLRTDIGQLIGTLPYMSPEQLAGDPADLDIRCDIYALGVIGYELLCGRLPYDVHGRPLADVVRILTEDAPLRPRSVARGLPADVETILLKALHRDKPGRYASCAELGADLSRFLDNVPIQARRPSPGYHLLKLVQRHKLACGLAAAAGAALVTFAVVIAVQYQRLTTQHIKSVAAEHQAASEAAKAERVTAFLQDMLASANPARADGGVALRQMLDRAAERVPQELHDHPAVAAAVHTTLGRTYTSLSDYNAAERHLQVALELNSALLGNADPATVRSQFELGVLRHSTGDLDRAVTLLLDVLARQRVLRGDHRLDTLRTLALLTSLLHSKGDHGQAEPLMVDAVALYSDLESEGAVLAGIELTGLAVHLCHNGNGAEAVDLYRRATERHRRAFGQDHPQVADDLEGWAGLLSWLNEWDDAEALMADALAMRERLVGKDHPQIAETRRLQGHQQRWKGDRAAAADHYEAALRIWRRQVGPRHLHIAETLYALGDVQQRDGDVETAERTFRDALAMFIVLLGETHWDVAVCRARLAELVQEQGDLAEAADLLAGAVLTFERVLHADHARVHATRARWGRCLCLLGDPAGAVQLRRAVADLEGRSGTEPAGLRQAGAWLAECERDGGE